MEELNAIAKDARLKVLQLIFKAQTSHIGSNFSVIDILAVLFNKVDMVKDEVVLSAGWKAAAWYYFLWRKGVITEEELNSFCMEGSQFIGLVEPMERWGLRIAGGSMGLGFPASVGMAMAKKMKGEEGTVYCLMSDGEQAIGTTHESALIAAHHNLHNLVVIVDNNGLQAMGPVSQVLCLQQLEQIWWSWGWDWVITDGHDFHQIQESLERNTPHIKPTVIIANTTKGKGVSFMANENLWHYAQIKDDDYEKARAELNG